MRTSFLAKILSLVCFILPLTTSFASAKAKTESDFVKWWKGYERDKCVKLSKLSPLAKTSSLDLPDSQLPLKVYKLHKTSFGDILLVGENKSGKSDVRAQPMKAWIGIDSRNRWTPIEVDINGAESYGPDEIDICIYIRKEKTYLDVTTNGPSCVPSKLYELRDPELVKIADKCGG